MASHVMVRLSKKNDWLSVHGFVCSRHAGRRGMLWLGTVQQTRGGRWTTPLSELVCSETVNSNYGIFS
jgi:hypothetical protein